MTKSKISPGILYSCLLFFCAGTVFGQFPTDTQLTKVDMKYGTPRPAYLDSIIDPEYGTTLTRISDETVFGPTQVGPSDWWAPYRRHRWFKMQPWNADGTRILIDLTYPNYLVDGTTYKFIKRFDPAKPQNHPPTEAVWSNVDPNIMYGVSGNSFIKYNVKYGTRSTLHTFPNYNNISIGLYEGNVSNDDNYVALWCPKGSKYYTIVYDINKDSIISTYDMGPQGQQDFYETSGLNWVCISQTGKFVVVQWQRSGTGRDMGIEVFDNKMNFLRQITPKVKNSYNVDMGLDADGNDVLVYQDLSNCNIMTHRLSDGQVTKVLDGSKISLATTISCRNLNRPGWAYFGDFEATQASVGEFHAAGKSEPAKASYNTVFALKLDGSQIVEVFGHMHHSSNEGLYLQPMPVPSRDGKKVMFASDWEEENQSITSVGGPFKYTRVYDYVAEYLSPTIPQNLAARDLTSSGFKLSWNASLDDNPEIIYEVLKDSVSLGFTNDTAMMVTGLSSESKVKMTVRAKDKSGRTSPSSLPLEVTTYKTGVISVTGKNPQLNVAVYPNPVNEKALIYLNAKVVADYRVSIFDLTGKNIYDKLFRITNAETIEFIPSLRQSVYLLRVSGNNQVVSQKIIQN